MNFSFASFFNTLQFILGIGTMAANALHAAHVGGQADQTHVDSAAAIFGSLNDQLSTMNSQLAAAQAKQAAAGQ